MTRSKKLYLLIGVLAVGCSATFAVTRIEEQKEQIKNSEEIILEIDTDNVQTLSWEYEEQNFAFHKDEGWLYDTDEAFPVDEDKITDLISIFNSFGTSFAIEDVEDFGQYGLTDPICTINLTTEDKTYQIDLGDYSKMDAKRYVSIGDGNVYLVNTDPLDTFDITLGDIIKQDKIPLLNQVNHVSIQGTQTWELTPMEEGTEKYTYYADDKYFTDLGEGYIPVDSSVVSSYLSSVYSLNLTDYVTYNASEDELKTYGLNEPELTLTIGYTDTYAAEDENADKSFVLNISREAAQKEAVEAAETEDADVRAYARVDNSQIIYEISSSDYKKLMACSYNDFRHKKLFTGDFTSVTQIDISLEDINYTITSAMKDDILTYYYEEEEQSITDLKTAVRALEAESFTEEAATLKEEISLVLHQEHEYFPQVEITLYRYDGEYCLAVVDDASVALIPRSDMVDLVEAVFRIVL